MVTTTQVASGPEVHVMEDDSTEVSITKKTPDFNLSKTVFKTGDSVKFAATPKSQIVVSGSKAVATETNLFEKEKEDLINYLEPLSGHSVKESEFLLFKGGNSIPDTRNVSSGMVSCENVGKCFLMKLCIQLTFKLNILVISIFLCVKFARRLFTVNNF